MDDVIELAGKYNFEVSLDEKNNSVYVSTKSATSILYEDVEKLKKLTDAEKAEIYADPHTDYNFLIQLKREG